MIINAGIKRVICEKRYHAAKLTREFFKKAGITLIALNEETETYKDM